MFYTKFRLHLTEIMFLGRRLPPLMEKPSFGSTNNCLIQLRDCCDACQVLYGFTMFPTKTYPFPFALQVAGQGTK